RPVAPHLGPDPREMRHGQWRFWIGEVHRPGRIEAGDPGFLIPFLIVRPGDGAYRGVVPRLAGVPGIGPRLLGTGGIVVHGRTRTFVAAGIAVDHDQPVHRLRVGRSPARGDKAAPRVAHDCHPPKTEPVADLL